MVVACVLGGVTWGGAGLDSLDSAAGAAGRATLVTRSDNWAAKLTAPGEDWRGRLGDCDLNQLHPQYNALFGIHSICTPRPLCTHIRLLGRHFRLLPHHPWGDTREQLFDWTRDKSPLAIPDHLHAPLPSRPVRQVVRILLGVRARKVDRPVVQGVNGRGARVESGVLDIGEPGVIGIGMIDVHRSSMSALLASYLQVAKLCKKHAEVFGRERIGKATSALLC